MADANIKNNLSEIFADMVNTSRANINAVIQDVFNSRVPQSCILILLLPIIKGLWRYAILPRYSKQWSGYVAAFVRCYQRKRKKEESKQGLKKL